MSANRFKIFANLSGLSHEGKLETAETKVLNKSEHKMCAFALKLVLLKYVLRGGVESVNIKLVRGLPVMNFCGFWLWN